MNSLNYHHLFYFWMVCREGSFTKASLKLRVSQSAVSEQVSRLEESLGQRLIDRTTRRFELTESGAIALKYAETIFAAGDELVDFMQHRPTRGRQTIRIGALGSLSRNLQVRFLRPLLGRQDLRFQVTVGDSRRLFRMLREHALDVVLSTFPAGETEGSGALYTHLLTESPLCLLAKKGAKVAKRRKLEQLLESEAIYLPTAALESRADFDHFVESNQLSLSNVGDVDDMALLRLLALSGTGLVVMPRMGAIADIESGELVVLHQFKTIRQKFYAITRQKRFPNPILAELMRSATSD